MKSSPQLTVCTHCFVHVAHERGEAVRECPFCGEEQAPAPRDVVARFKGVGSRLAAALGVTMTLTGGIACQRPSPAMDIYGGPPIEEEEPVSPAPSTPSDMAADSAADAPPVVDDSIRAPAYGGPPMDERPEDPGPGEIDE